MTEVSENTKQNIKIIRDKETLIFKNGTDLEKKLFNTTPKPLTVLNIKTINNDEISTVPIENDKLTAMSIKGYTGNKVYILKAEETENNKINHYYLATLMGMIRILWDTDKIYIKENQKWTPQSKSTTYWDIYERQNGKIIGLKEICLKK